MVGKPFAGGAQVGIFVGVIDEVGLIKSPFCSSTGRVRLGDGDGDTGLFTRDDLLALIVTLSAIASIVSAAIASRALCAIIARASRS
jgi:hypothetical protein